MRHPLALVLHRLTSTVEMLARPAPAAPAPRREPADPRELMAQLLARALASNTATSRQDLHIALLRRVVPDEARIIAALARSAPSPLVSVYRRASADPVLENASLVGRTAAVTLPSLTPRYVTHLLQLGILETGPEDTADKHGYELVLAERDVREALKAGELGKVPPRVVRRTVRLSALGWDLWEASCPDGGGS